MHKSWTEISVKVAVWRKLNHDSLFSLRAEHNGVVSDFWPTVSDLSAMILLSLLQSPVFNKQLSKPSLWEYTKWFITIKHLCSTLNNLYQFIGRQSGSTTSVPIKLSGNYSIPCHLWVTAASPIPYQKCFTVRGTSSPLSVTTWSSNNSYCR